MLPSEPSWKDEPAVQAVVSKDLGALLDDHHAGLMKVLGLTHAGMTTDDFNDRVTSWIASSRHPRFKRPYTETVYQPMLELLAYLRSRGFETWIVSGGGQEFMRVFAETTYGIPPQQIIGSHGRLKYELADGIPTLTKTLDTLFVDDKEGKPVGDRSVYRPSTHRRIWQQQRRPSHVGIHNDQQLASEFWLAGASHGCSTRI